MPADDATLRQALSDRTITVEFAEVTDETVYVGYESDRNETPRIYTELRTVIEVALRNVDQPKSIEATLLHTQRPIIARWRIRRDWVRAHEDGRMSETELVARVLDTLDAVQFQ